MGDLINSVERDIGATQLLVPGDLRSLLCSTTYANDHVIRRLLQDASRNAIRAVLDAIAEPTEAMVCIGDEEIVQVLNAQSFLKALDEGTPALRCYRAMIAALRKEVEKS